MKTVIFNEFKARLLRGEVKNEFNVNFWPIRHTFAEAYTNDSINVRNFKTISQLNDFRNLAEQLSYTFEQSLPVSFYTEYLSQPHDPYTYYKDIEYTDGNNIKRNMNIKMNGPIYYDYCGARMKILYGHESTPDMVSRWKNIYNTENFKKQSDSTSPKMTGTVRYINDLRAFMVHVNSTLDHESEILLDDGVMNDGTVFYMGNVPWYPRLVQDLATNGSRIYRMCCCTDIGGILIADDEGNLIEYIDFEEKKEVYGTFSYEFKRRYSIDGTHYAVLFDVEM